MPKQPGRYRHAIHWRKMWKKHPDTMRSNLDKIHQDKARQKEQTIQKIRNILAHLPDQIPATKSKALFAHAMKMAGSNPTADRLHRFRVYATRYGMLRFVSSTQCWHKQFDP